MFTHIDSQLFSWVILPILIMLSRIADQTLGSMRLIFLAKGEKLLAPLLGFFEVIIWLIAVAQIMKHLDNVMCFIGYGLGFALGNYIGIIIEEKLSLGNVIIRMIPQKDTAKLVNALRSKNIGVTTVQAEGKKGSVQIVLTIIKRKQINNVINTINEYNPNIFYTIEEIKSVREGIMEKETKTSIFQRFKWGLKKH